jgi:hypothetical protein
MLKVGLLLAAFRLRDPKQRKALVAAANNANLRTKIRNEVIRLEEQRTGKKLKAIGDGQLIELLLKYLPQIIQLIMSLIG